MRRHTTNDPLRAARIRNAAIDALVDGLPAERLEALMANWEPSRTLAENLDAFRTLSTEDAIPGRLLPTPPDAFTRLRDEVAQRHDPRKTPGYSPTGKAPSPYDAALDARRKGARS